LFFWAVYRCLSIWLAGISAGAMAMSGSSSLISGMRVRLRLWEIEEKNDRSTLFFLDLNFSFKLKLLYALFFRAASRDVLTAAEGATASRKLEWGSLGSALPIV